MIHDDGSAAHTPASASVVVGVDGSPAGNLAARWAAEVAARRNRELLLVRGLNLDALYGPPKTRPRWLREAVYDMAEQAMAEATAHARKVDPELRIRHEIEPGDPVELLIEHSRSAYLVVLGGPEDRLGLGRLGSVLLSVASRAQGPVAVVRGGRNGPTVDGPVVVGVDGSPVSEAATAVAFDVAASRNAALVAVHCWSDPFAGKFARLLQSADEAIDSGAQARALLSERLAGWREEYPRVTVEPELSENAPQDELLSRSESAQLIVVGSRGRGGFARLLLGSTSSSLLDRAQCPIVVVPPPQ
ncbi:universal stress protein [Nocardia sp. NPDC048505]|uniref:universal stress protein n=1 Tax=unclassified Nocardia TaxID=2637762 RepID=UPI0033DF194C